MRAKPILFVGLVLVTAVGMFLLGHTLGKQPGQDSGRASTAAVDSRDSLFYMPFENLINRSGDAQLAARLILRYLDSGDRQLLLEALPLYDDLILVENFGGEYPALRWLCEYELADDEAKEAYREDPDGRRFLHYFQPNEYEQLRWYLVRKYGLRKPSKLDELRFVDELVRFNNPARKQWEHTEEILDAVGLQPGDQVADIGAGSGFYSFRLAQRVGSEGRVYAIETNRRHVTYLQEVVEREGLTNLHPMFTDRVPDSIDEDSLDVVFLCSTYQAIYASLRREARDTFIASLHRALKPGGKLVISENATSVQGAVPYRGISIDPSVVKGQLQAYGFTVVQEHQFIPQRYIVIFEE